MIKSEKHKIGNVEYDGVSYSDILDVLRGIPEIEIRCARKGLARNGYFEPAYLDLEGTCEMRILRSIRGDLNYNPNYGCVINVSRVKTPFKQKALKALGLSESKKQEGIEDLVLFLRDKIGAQPFRIRTESGEGCDYHVWYPYPFLIYLEFGAEVKGEVRYVNLDQKEFDWWCADNLVSNGHIVKPTIISCSG